MIRAPIYLRRHTLTALAALAAALALAACGSSSSSNSAIRTTFSAYEKAITAGNGTAACRLVTGEMRTQFAVTAQDTGLGDSCPDYVAKQPNRADDKRSTVSITRITIDGDHASAAIAVRFKPFAGRPTGASTTAEASFVRSGGRWLVGETRVPMPVGVKGQLFKTGSTLAAAIAKKFASNASAKSAPR